MIVTFFINPRQLNEERDDEQDYTEHYSRDKCYKSVKDIVYSYNVDERRA